MTSKWVEFEGREGREVEELGGGSSGGGGGEETRRLEIFLRSFVGWMWM